MTARCETVGKYVMPVFRALVAKELVKSYHLTQTEAAKKLGMTQAAISQYVASKRAIRGSERFASTLPKIQRMANETAMRLAKNEMSWNEVTADFCKLCSTLVAEEEQTEDDYTV